MNKQAELTTIICVSVAILIYAGVDCDFLVSAFQLQRLQRKSGCPTSSFTCHDGSCIPVSWVCDSENDCGDKSDETQETCQSKLAYSMKRCSSLEFLCEEGICLDVHKVCDSKADCANGRDEDDDVCKNFSCDRNEFACMQVPFRCIPILWTCDGDKDCLDGTDEANCNKTCAAEQFQCDDGSCVDARYACNGQPDCIDGSDETNCTQPCDPSSHFECSPNHCIDKLLVCDGVANCQQGQDEQNCTPVTKINPSVCLSTEKLCANLVECIHMNWWCDGTPDCSDGSDESPESCPNSTCPGEFRCGSGECVIRQLHCNGHLDCFDGSDELNCVGEYNPCSDPAQFHCGGRLCIERSSVCDGRKDCPDGSDEPRTCHVNECLRNNGNCSQICTDTAESFKCGCYEGFRMDGEECVDVNECSEFGACSQICRNTIGSFVCSCIDGYMSDPAELRRCKVTYDVPFLLVGYSNEIRQILTNGGEPRFISLAHTPTCMDYFYDNRTVIWSEASSKKVYTVDVDKKGTLREVTFLSGQNIDSFAVDWTEQNVYWTSIERGAIGVSTFSTQQHIILFNDLVNPCCIIVDPSTKWMYWANSAHYAKIERAGMDASAREVLTSDDILLVVALTLDFVQQRLYWVDSHLNKIFSIKTDGLGRQTIIYSPFLKNPVSLAVFEDYVFWANKGHSRILRANKFTGHNVTFISHQNSSIPVSSVIIFHRYNQPLLSKVCQSVNYCSHICLPSAVINGSIQTHRCVCPENEQNCIMGANNSSKANKTHTTEKDEDYSTGYETLYAGSALFVTAVLFSSLLPLNSMVIS